MIRKEVELMEVKLPEVWLIQLHKRPEVVV